EDEEMAYRDVEGQPCPDGPREETAFQQYPGLYEELEEGLHDPLPYAGGDRTKPCGAWETTELEAARQLAAECPPLIRGEI
ncbi:hypothetical protein, partial [Saccharopolyspora rhizosphaerae]|uniref:hypothetical protein n=1 Tax=Saccharopolyspora rhizosphaerae TaxID=2492662 RepID=UPI001F3D14CB